MSYCIYTEGSQPGSGRIVSSAIPSKTRAVWLARAEASRRLRGCDYIAVMPVAQAQALIRSGRRA